MKQKISLLRTMKLWGCLEGFGRITKEVVWVFWYLEAAAAN